MQSKLVARLCAATFLALLPSYLVERITEYEFLTSSPAFFTWSGLRTELFISSILIGAVAAGYLVRQPLPSAGAFVLGVLVLVSLFYYFCDPRVCYSSGIDGLEPLRMGSFFSCIGIVGTSIGAVARTGRSPASAAEILAPSLATVGAVAYYPIMFTIAGTRLLTPIDPLPLLLVVGLLSFVMAARITKAIGWTLGLAAPFISVLLLLGLAAGIARQYLPEEVPEFTLIVSVALLASLVGVLTVVHVWSHSSIQHHLVESNKMVSLSVLLVLLMTAVFLPNAANGIIPSNNGQNSVPSFALGAPVYAGGFMTLSFVRTTAVSVTVDFTGTNPSVIQDDNFLSAGMGVHSPHCCVDGIDFGYRFDAYLFHDGSEVLVASVWEVCDTIMACGGHSWQNLLFLAEKSINATTTSSLHLVLQWMNKTVYWTYGVGQAPLQNFTFYNPPGQENAYFNAGVLGDIPASPAPPTPFHYGLPTYFVSTISTGILFFQYGIMSRYPIGHGGWSVAFTCPAYLDNGNWTCVTHSESVQGDQSYWKAVWRWGEPYANVMVVANGSSPSLTFTYNPSSTLENFEQLW